MDTLRRRLHQSGLAEKKFEFVEDDEDGGKSASTPKVNDKRIVPVKTLIWELFRSDQEENDYSPYYFATALNYHDRVDEEKLKAQLLLEGVVSSFANIGVKIVSLNLANTERAEELTGYMSGTIPPVGHATPMLLVVDRSLAGVVSKEKDTVLSLRSGSFRHSLWMSLLDMLDSAKVLTKGVCISSISTQGQNNRMEETVIKQPLDDSPKAETLALLHETEMEQMEKGGALKCPLPPATSPSLEEDGIQSLYNLLREACFQKGRAHVIQSVIDQVGDRFPELVQQEEAGFTRNPFHVAAWKSDLESLELLIETGKQHGLDLVNAMVTGKHNNYGKTAIFYAINNHRDDVVRLLLKHGTNLLIRNQKGNTPCGLAESRLEADTLVLLQKTHKEQLEKGGKYLVFTPQGEGNMSRDTKAKTRVPLPPSPSSEKDDIQCLSKLLHEACIQKGKAYVIQSVIDQVGDQFPELVQEQAVISGFSGNPFHLAAWKSDLESIELLIETGKWHGLDLVNIILTGKRSYEKTDEL